MSPLRLHLGATDESKRKRLSSRKTSPKYCAVVPFSSPLPCGGDGTGSGERRLPVRDGDEEGRGKDA